MLNKLSEPRYLVKKNNSKGQWKKESKWKNKKKTWLVRRLQAEQCEDEKGAPCQGRWWMRFRLQALPAAPSGVDSTLTLIMLCEILRPGADERKHATQFICQPGCTFTKYTLFSLTLTRTPSSSSSSSTSSLSLWGTWFNVGWRVFLHSSSSLHVWNMKNKTGSKPLFYINHSGPWSLNP